MSVGGEQWPVRAGQPPVRWERPGFPQLTATAHCPLPKLPSEGFDCIASIATLHHLPLREILLKMKAALKPGGVLLILDLFEPSGVVDTFLNPPAIAVSAALRLIHHGRLLPSPEARDAWATHESHDLYPTMTRAHELCGEILPAPRSESICCGAIR